MTIDRADYHTPAPALELLRHLMSEVWTSAQIADFYRDLPREHDHVLGSLEQECNDSNYDGGYADGLANGKEEGYDAGYDEGYLDGKAGR
jgi:flagellar biosynthesis/type III secretory pathway protein FliH